MPRLGTAAVRQRLVRLKGWKQTGSAIQKQYSFAGFKEAMFFVNGVAATAEKVGHHPDILVRFNRVVLTLSTHDVGGVTAKDFALAKRVDA